MISNKTLAKAFTPPAETKMDTRPDRAVTREFIGAGVYSQIFLFCPTNFFLNQLLLGTDHYFFGGGGWTFRQCKHFFGAVVFANNSFAPATFCKQFISPLIVVVFIINLHKQFSLCPIM